MHQLLRPSKIRNAVGRRAFEAQLRRTLLAPYGLVHLGTEYGGWWIPDGVVSSDWLCYSVGAGHDVSFDAELLKRYGARVRAFDPFDVFHEMALEQTDNDPRYSFHEVAIAATDGPIEMYGRQDLEKGSVSAVNLFDVDARFVKPGRSLPSLMAEFGDDEVQLLKFDVEGSEYEILPTLDLMAMGVQVFCVELHHNESAQRARRLLADLGRQGYDVVHRKEPTSFTLVRTGARRA